MPKRDGFGKPEGKPGPASQRDPWAVPPVDPTPDAKAMKRGSGERKRHGSVTSPLSEPERALVKDAAKQARQLKRDHRELYSNDPWRFRQSRAGRSIRRFPAEAGTQTRPESCPPDRPRSPEAGQWGNLAGVV